MDQAEVITAICLAVVIIILLYLISNLWLKHSSVNTFVVKSRIDDEEYQVHKAFTNSMEAADKLAQINARMINLLRSLKKRYLNDIDTKDPDDYTPRQKQIVFLLNNYNPSVIIENSPHNINKYTSYTNNKGELLALCLRPTDSHNEEFHQMNTLIFVALHELSHMMTYEFGHGKTFWKNFRFLLEEAVLIKIYEPINYAISSEVYCGLKIDYNPLYDNSVIDDDFDAEYDKRYTNLDVVPDPEYDENPYVKDYSYYDAEYDKYPIPIFRDDYPEFRRITNRFRQELGLRKHYDPNEDV